MQILEIKGKKWMVGIEWEILPGDSAIKIEAKEVAEKTNSKFGIVVEYDSTYALGLTNKKTKEPSAAYSLATANQNFRESGLNSDYPDWIVLEEVSEEKYWMGVIKSGIPAPQFDAVLSMTEIKERITELLINDTYSVYSSAGEIIAIFDGIKSIENKSLNDLTADIPNKVKYEKLLGIPDSVIYSLIGILVVGAIGFGALQLVEGYSLREKAKNLANQKEKERVARADKYKKDLELYSLAKGNNEKAEIDKIVLGLSGNPSKILSAFYENVGTSDMGTHGWIMKNVECYFDVIPSVLESAGGTSNSEYPRLACDYLYERTSLATTRMLLEDFPDAKINGDKAVVTKKVKIEPQYISKAELNILDTISPSKSWGFNVQSQLQLLKVAEINHEIKASSEIVYQVPGKPVSPEDEDAGKKSNPPESVSLGLGLGEITVKGNNFDLVKELADNVDFSGTGLRKVIFTVKGLGEIAWEAKFNYYVKTKDGGIGSSTTANMSSSSIPQSQAQSQQPQSGIPTVPQQLK